MNPLLQGTVLAVLSGVIAYIFTSFRTHQNESRAEARDLQARIGAIELQLARISTQISPMWAKVQAQIAEDLHHPHARYVEMDKLLEKLEAMTITADERSRLKELLMERSMDFHEDISEDQRKKALLMILVMDAVLTEAAGGVS